MEPIPSIGIIELLVCGGFCLSSLAVIVAIVAIVLVFVRRQG